MNQNPEQNKKEEEQSVAPVPTEESSTTEAPALKVPGRRKALVVDILLRILMLCPALLSVIMVSLAEIPEGAEAPDVGFYKGICYSVIMVSVAYAVLWKRFGEKGRLYRRVIQFFTLVLAPLACFYIVERLFHDLNTIYTRDIMALNALFFYLITLVVLFISGRPAIALSFTVVLTAVAGIANNLAIQARSIPVYPWDLNSVGIALSVANNYDFVITWEMAGMISALGGLLLLSFMAWTRLNLKYLAVRLTAVVLSVAALFGYVGYLSTDRVWKDFGLYPYLFTPQVLYERNGFMVSFMAYLKYLKQEKPEGYSEEELRTLMAAYEEIAAASGSSDRPNVIVIMNEALSDVSVLTGGRDYWLEKDPLEFFNSLEEDTVRGYVYASVKGGNTANSEFEFLTGLSMAYLPMGSIPYQQYIKDETPTLATQFSSLGYDTYAMHPYLASGWKRDQVYVDFGFDHMCFSSEFYDHVSHYQRVRGYISDRSLVNKIVSTFTEQNKQSDDPMFVFAVSMQNHGGYTDAAKYDNFKQTIHAKGLENMDVLTTYLSLLEYTDKAFEYLVSYFEKVSEPTVILMFGDHQPNDNVVDALAALYGTDISSDLTAQQQRYKVPFVLWANYDIEEQSGIETSINYLSTVMKEAVDLPLTPLEAYLSVMRETIPVINQNGYRVAGSTQFTDTTDLDSDPFLNCYNMLQYNYLFDRKHLVKELFLLPKAAR